MVSHARAHRSRRGLSLSELILSLGIIGTCLVLVVGMVTFLVNGSQKAADVTAGAVMADSLLSQYIYQVMSAETTRTAYFQSSQPNPEVVRGGSCALNTSVYFYKIYSQDIAIGTRLRCVDTDGARGRTPMKRLDIVVWWNDSAASSATTAEGLAIHAQSRQQGLQEVHQVRVVWPNGGY